jgi:1-deoxy-D-xylulose-5-phosphate synthase
VQELSILAEEIRERIISVVSESGGHLASNFGVVELTLALYHIFDPPRDVIIWDVGHQTYAQKLLTGRKDRFHTLRQYGGLSGFPKREESPYDPFTLGHSGTSISMATGVIEARCLKKEDYKIIAVIGDGSMTAGIAFEGLNQAGDRDKDLIVILNDNEMSISTNVGALSSYMNRIMTGQFFTRFRDEMKTFLKTLPGVGESVSKIVKKSEEYMKGFITPGLIFEELGFKYVGPIDGHRLDHLTNTLSNVRNLKGPILVHVVTKKGKGYAPAEEDPTAFHGVGPFERETGTLKKKTGGHPSYTQVFGKTLVELARNDKRIVAITAAMPQGTGLEDFTCEFPNRFFDVGIAEQHGVTFASGLASKGFRPVVAIYSTFLQRAYDQIFHDVCLQGLPVVFALDRGGVVGEDGQTHQGLFDLSYLRHLPNMVVMAPKDEAELRDMMITALSQADHPIAVRYPRGKGVGVSLSEPPTCLEIGKGEIMTRGSDLLILAVGATVYPSIEAARLLEKEGIAATVVNCRFIKPIDVKLLRGLIAEIDKVITVEENVLDGGFGSAVLEMMASEGLWSRSIRRIGIPDAFVEHGSQDMLRSIYGLNAEGIVAIAKQLFNAPRMISRLHTLKG